MNTTLRLMTILLTVSVSVAEAQFDWPQWRGPLSNGVAEDADPPLTWGEEENVHWKVRIAGEGHATPIVSGGRIFVATAIDSGKEAESPIPPRDDAKTVPPKNIYDFVLLCLDVETGRELWRRTATSTSPQEGRHTTNSYASGSPVTDGERVYISFGSYGVFAFTVDGEPVWQRDLGDMRTRYGWGEGTSPAVWRDLLFLTWDHEDQSYLYALDTSSGEIRWKVERDEPTSWATPLVIDAADQPQLIVNGTNRARSYDPRTGEVLWECGGQTVNAIPSPVADDAHVYCMSGYRGSALFAIPLSSRGDLTDTEQIPWSFHRGTPYVPSPVLVDGRLYFTAANTNVLTCLDVKTGAVLFGPVRLPEIDSLYASPVAAAGRIYFAGRNGATTVIAAGDAFEVLATNRLDEGIDASPVAIGDRMLIRTSTHLYSLRDEGGQQRKE